MDFVSIACAAPRRLELGRGARSHRRELLLALVSGFATRRKADGYGISAAVNHRASMLVALGSFGLLGLLQVTSIRRSAVWFNVTMVKKKHTDWFREDLGTLIQLLVRRRFTRW